MKATRNTASQKHPVSTNQKHAIVLIGKRSHYSVCYTEGAERVYLATIVEVRSKTNMRRVTRTNDLDLWKAVRSLVLDSAGNTK